MKNYTNYLTITIFLILFNSFCLNAQNQENADYLVLKTGDSIFGTVEYINHKGVSPKYYKKIRVRNAEGKRKKYNKKEVSVIRVDKVIYEAFWLVQTNQMNNIFSSVYYIVPKKGELYFLRLISNGVLSHYHLEWYEQGESSLMWMDLLKKEEDQFFIRATQGIFGLKRKALANYFEDCPDLKAKIIQKQINEVWQVVDYYNNNCTN
jgi:hypothetical protein